ncbi:hypothetical protein [Nostoc sp.]|uniref:hypothetical protein n=1 Tax=Nostoc sp. TaxID=1180 RepID=UPI002FF6A1B8
MLPGIQGHMEVTAKDNRLFVEADMSFTATDRRGCIGIVQTWNAIGSMIFCMAISLDMPLQTWLNLPE